MKSITIAEQRREQAIALRRAGRSRREIKEILGITSNETLDKALKGEPPAAWTLRPRAKDDFEPRPAACESRDSPITRSRLNSAFPRVPSHTGSATCPARSG